MRWMFALLACLAAVPCLAGPGTPYAPPSDDTVLQTVPTVSDPRVRMFVALREQLSREPRDASRAVKLAEAYLNFGRDTGDARYLGRAEAVIAPWLHRSATPIPVLLVHATVLQSRHDFSQSRALLLQILQLDNDNAQAWLTLATVEQVQGDLDGARRACAHLLGSSDPLIPAGCLASLNAVDGHAENSYHLLSLLWPQARSESAAVQSWIQGILADSAKYLGHPSAADQHFRAALQLAPGDNFVLADYGDFLLDQGRTQAALDLVKDYSQSDTSFLRQVFAEASLGSPQAGADAAEMARRFAALELRGTYAYRREQAAFVLQIQHDPQRALKLAEENWTVQRAPKDMRVLLAAALAAARPEAANPVLDLLAHSHLQYPLVLALADQVRSAEASAAPTRPQPTNANQSTTRQSAP